MTDIQALKEQAQHLLDEIERLEEPTTTTLAGVLADLPDYSVLAFTYQFRGAGPFYTYMAFKAKTLNGRPWFLTGKLGRTPLSSDALADMLSKPEHLGSPIQLATRFEKLTLTPPPDTP